jgi:hypothetical protein
MSFGCRARGGFDKQSLSAWGSYVACLRLWHVLITVGTWGHAWWLRTGACEISISRFRDFVITASPTLYCRWHTSSTSHSYPHIIRTTAVVQYNLPSVHWRGTTLAQPPMPHLIFLSRAFMTSSRRHRTPSVTLSHCHVRLPRHVSHLR